eukprot:TRINITY_DN17473_c0_g1_i1.p1 TRINITY_DN17473_c0_g1~~TRINITY_DN17473_c0_g1_i1.p1  ORF type:complete len:159 (-),score=38.60 TRINITY_DN17473_c0_g1_i1:9-485(-)
MFKELCDENTIRELGDKIQEGQIVEIQEFGCNPIKLFKEKHVMRETHAFDLSQQRTLFYNRNMRTKESYSLSRVYEFKNPIIAIKALDKKVIFLLSNRELHLVKDKNLNLKHFETSKPKTVSLKYTDSTLSYDYQLSLIHICRCRRYAVCRSRWSPYH